MNSSGRPIDTYQQQEQRQRQVETGNGGSEAPLRRIFTYRNVFASSKRLPIP